MRPLARQEELIELYSAIHDLQERMTLIVDRARRVPPLAEAEKTEAARVQGCVSRVWLRPELVGGCCHFRIDADSVLVRGLAAFLCEMYEGSTPAEVEAVEPQLLERLGLAANLSPTRLHGLAQIRRALREFARSVQAEAAA